MREIASIVICTISAALFFTFAYNEKKEQHTGGTVLMSILGSLSAVCILINAYNLLIK